MGKERAPVDGSGGLPEWTARVSNPKRGWSFFFMVVKYVVYG